MLHYVADGLTFRKGHRYHYVFTHRATRPRTYFTIEVSHSEDGRKTKLPYYYGDTLGDTVALAATSGVDFVTFSTDSSWGCEGWWNPPEMPEDYSRIDNAFARLTKINPKALLVPRIMADAPDWMHARHPELRMIYEPHCGLAISSVSSCLHRKAACDAVEKLSRHLRAKFPRNYAGLQISGQNSAEWFYMLSQTEYLSGYDPCTRDAFREWLKAHGAADWAAADSSNPMCRRKGYQEQVMEGAKGYYDVHPTHQHSGFGAYENDNLTKFFPMRERLGINVPWYANETALTGVNGAEDGVARNVWMKILWSWAHGSTDYIWYNLRATGWKPADPEQWYGLVTADYYPRAGFAAFSALAHVLSGLDFARIVHEGKGRHLFLFKGERGGVALQVLAGWDGFTDPPHPIPVKTDASRAFSIDLMGNIRPAEKRDGGFVFGISKMPGALVMEGASFAEPDAAAAATIVP